METSPAEKVILVTGVTGAGKSSFIQTITGDSNVVIGHGLHSSTQAITTYLAVIEGTHYRFLDTPGFNDTVRSEMDVLLCITSWLCDLYCANIRITGIVHVHRISDDRIQGSSFRNLRMLEALCGETCMPNVILMTTHWDKVPTALGQERESELRSGFWNQMIQKGAQTARFDGSATSGWKIAVSLKNCSPVVLAIQEQMIDQGKVLSETDAGQVVNEELVKIQRRTEMELRHVQETLQLQTQNNAQAQADRAEYARGLEKALQDAKMNQQALLAQTQRTRAEWEARFAKLYKKLLEQEKKGLWNFLTEVVTTGLTLVFGGSR
ncbi:P-loop containing nucleoside triphosphate hydrolase protein [Terfezia claveryi]|nr:P-loop containing nucleoside triphosphate hydrolase protein [Terfezia claveryi]KAF8435214.1 P-loop containing nucleoside triphosphate hydrolase protein [Terfezia claveryi]KAF8446669.1 P-loop containing nucleoside triphosphate hydrolase protein [Terfezia claveryi]